MTIDNKELKVAALKEGTVIDHIPSDKLFKVIAILNLKNTHSQITFGYNLDSAKLGKKAIIKISEKFLEQTEVNKVALIAPHAKINIIRDYKVVEKMALNYPKEVVGVVKCLNPKCITNNEPMKTKFRQLHPSAETYVCHYCEKTVDVEDIVVL